MSIHVGVTNLDGHTEPAIGCINNRESETTVGTEKERCTSGNYAYFVPHKYSRKDVTVTGVGDAELSLVTAGAITAGTFKVLRAKQSETASGLPKFERTGVLLANLS